MIGAVVLLLCIGGGVLTAVLVAQSDPSTSPTVASSNPTTTAPTGSPTNGGTHTRFTNSCAPVAGALAANGLALPEPRANDSDIGPTELFFCSGSLTKAGARSGYLSVTAVLYDDFAGRTAAERGMRGHEADRKADETAGGTVTDVSGVGEKAYMVTRMSGGQVISVQIAAVDNNLNVSARITLDDLTLAEATKVATDIVKAYIAA
ncbi:MAG TPA: hypothetical protein VGR21_06070 [Cryptosporangiaceae bacterium]|nr:hypothetical protein [Cryptosporangiaceae bacterium]